MCIVTPIRAKGHCGLLLASIAGAVCFTSVASHLSGQVILNDGVFIASALRADVTGSASSGFTVRKVSQTVADSMEEFERFSGKAAWERAFASLPAVLDSSSTGLVPADAGFYLPMRVRVRQLLVGLSPAGREAYRVFNDGKARQELSQIVEADDPNTSGVSTEIPRLQELFDKYFITSVGDQIGDRLGDAKFESGDFAGAAECWGAIIRDYPDTALSPLKLNAKRVIALARARRWEDFNSAAAYLREKFGGESVRLGGRDVPVSALLTELSSAMPAAGMEKRPQLTTPSPIKLPGKDEPLWQSVFADSVLQAELDRAYRSSGMSNYATNPNLIGPQAIADDERIYLNWFGIGMALDAKSGKLLWRTPEGFTGLASRVQQAIAMGFDPTTDQAIMMLPNKDRLLLINPAQNATRQVIGGAIVTIGGTGQIRSYTINGQQGWTSQSGSLATWTLIGMPLLDGDTLYATGRSNNTSSATGMDLSLMAINANTGSLLWSLPLGTMAVMTNVRGVVMPKPILCRGGEMLFVQTGNSGVVAVNLPSRRIDWAYCWSVPAPAPNRAGQPNVTYVIQRADPQQYPASAAYCDSILFVKDRGSSTMYAIDTTGARLRWTRPVEANSGIAAADGTSVYLVGSGVDCIDIQTRELRWSSKTPGLSVASPPLSLGTHLYLYGARGVYDMDLATGDSKIFRGYDRESAGGSILRVGDRLICVSNRSVTAYLLADH